MISKSVITPFQFGHLWSLSIPGWLQLTNTMSPTPASRAILTSSVDICTSYFGTSWILFKLLLFPPSALSCLELAPPEGGTYVRTYKRTDERKISPFYRTSSPIGAAALPPPMKTKEKVEQGKGTADHLMPLGYLFFYFFFYLFFFFFFRYLCLTTILKPK